MHRRDDKKKRCHTRCTADGTGKMIRERPSGVWMRAPNPRARSSSRRESPIGISIFSPSCASSGNQPGLRVPRSQTRFNQTMTARGLRRTTHPAGQTSIHRPTRLRLTSGQSSRRRRKGARSPRPRALSEHESALSRDRTAGISTPRAEAATEKKHVWTQECVVRRVQEYAVIEKQGDRTIPNSQRML